MFQDNIPLSLYLFRQITTFTYNLHVKAASLIVSIKITLIDVLLRVYANVTKQNHLFYPKMFLSMSKTLLQEAQNCFKVYSTQHQVHCCYL